MPNLLKHPVITQALIYVAALAFGLLVAMDFNVFNVYRFNWVLDDLFKYLVFFNGLAYLGGLLIEQVIHLIVRYLFKSEIRPVIRLIEQLIITLFISFWLMAFITVVMTM